MKRPTLIIVLTAASALALTLPARAESASPADGSAAVEKSSKNTTTVVVPVSLEKAHGAVLEALAAIGCEIKQDTPTYVEGKRKNKVGLAVGSGGEKLLVWLKDKGATGTEVKVTTKKTMVGFVGQKLWNDEVAANVRNAAGK